MVRTDVMVLCLMTLTSFRVTSGCGKTKRPSPPRDTSPPYLTCPPDIWKTASSGQDNVRVHWSKPSAYDSGDGHNKWVQRSGPGPGSLFGEGSTRVTYSARDSSGNTASCSFRVHIRVIRCSRRWSTPRDGWRSCSPSSYDMRYGTRCRFGCYRGHVLSGGTTATCRSYGTWDMYRQPYCKKKTCQMLQVTGNQYDLVTISCTNKNYYRSTCEYRCVDGYGVKPGHNKERVCGENGHWLGTRPVCVDTRAPKFTKCPSVKTLYCEGGKKTGRAVGSIPQATDNSGSVDVAHASGPAYGSELSVGEYNVMYTATDAAANNATCQFKLIMKLIVCPEIVPLPYTSVTCPSGSIYGATCEFSCDQGTTSKFPMTTHCDRSGQWNFGDFQPYCERDNTCPALRPPDNGALVCDTWLAGRYCQMLCRHGFTAHHPDGSGIHGNMLVCGDSGEWRPSGGIANCQPEVRRRGTQVVTTIPYGYFTGPCENATAEIRKQFLEKFHKMRGCQPPACLVEKVKIICVTTSKRDTATYITIKVDVTLSGDLSYPEVVETREILKQDLAKSRTNGDLDIDVDNETLSAGVPNVGPAEIVCPERSVKDTNNDLKCVQCGAGSYQDNSAQPSVCRKCDFGHFTAEPGQTSCLPCPPGTTTERSGSTACIDLCPHGHYSAKGTVPCSPCGLGKYSGTEGARNCSLCPGSTNTDTTGSTSIDACFDFDLVFTAEDTEAIFVGPFVIVNMTSVENMMAIKNAKLKHITSQTNKTTDALLDDIDASQNVTFNEGTFSDNERVYSLVNSTQNSSMEDMPGEISRSTSSKENITSGINMKTMEMNVTSEVNMKSEKNLTLETNMTSDEDVTSQTNMTSEAVFSVSMWLQCDACSDVLNITGDDGDRYLSVTGNGETLELTVGSATVTYHVASTLNASHWWYLHINWYPGIITMGVDDEPLTSVDHSLALPLMMGVGVGGPEFVGKVSHLNVFSSVARWRGDGQNSTCVPSVPGDLMSWKAFASLEGSFVQTRSQCDACDNCLSLPCQNGGSCSDAINSFMCACAEGFTGSDCSVNIDDCDTSMCENNGTCVDGVNGYNCSCPGGFDGKYCKIQVVDGGWGEFGNWSLCSVTCGTGQRVRNRTCDSPEPSNGGKQCEGQAHDVIECVIEKCVYECDHDPAPIEHGSLNCSWEVAVGWQDGEEEVRTRRCYPACDAGYDFDSDFLVLPPNVHCGPDTGFLWNIGGADNPDLLLPSCKEISKGKQNFLFFTADYRTLTRLDDHLLSDIETIVVSRANTTYCVSELGRCDVIHVDVMLVDESSSRLKRSSDLTPYVKFNITFACEIKSDIIDECYDLLASVAYEMNDFISNHSYTVTDNGVNYDVTINSTSVDGTTVCDGGYVPVFQYCIPCGAGMYQKGAFCEKCGRGEYQDVSAQQRCKACPYGWTTTGLQSRNVSFCNVEAPEPSIMPAVIVIISVIVMVITVFIVFIRSETTTTTRKTTTTTPESTTTPLKTTATETTTTTLKTTITTPETTTVTVGSLTTKIPTTRVSLPPIPKQEPDDVYIYMYIGIGLACVAVCIAATVLVVRYCLKRRTLAQYIAASKIMPTVSPYKGDNINYMYTDGADENST